MAHAIPTSCNAAMRTTGRAARVVAGFTQKITLIQVPIASFSLRELRLTAVNCRSQDYDSHYDFDYKRH